MYLTALSWTVWSKSDTQEPGRAGGMRGGEERMDIVILLEGLEHMEAVLIRAAEIQKNYPDATVRIRVKA